MKITLLGTGDSPGTPILNCHCRTCEDARKNGWQRLRFSILIQNKGKNILIDTSPDLRMQLMRANVEEIEAVIWTHCHFDHFAGFGEFYRVQDNVKVYTSKEVHEDIGNYMKFLKYRKIEVEPYKPFEIAGIKFTLADVNHPPMRRAHGVVAEWRGYKIVISGDTNKNLSENTIEVFKNPDLFIVDAIAPENFKLRKHMNAETAMKLADEIGARKTVFTHIGHFYPPHSEAIKVYPLGYDFETFYFDRERDRVVEARTLEWFID
ncbi:Metal-dependent hydrolases of the beta-lactamase superfamily I [Archaeoglobus sulfaticallidus PM70-1]|uniref:Metal-dependent hydrolases of the beta-lactamase superfamily I n=1 Tax=Archaeoglobus sulfaticallidus PM70-1 TaxID=387631 RepID=N0BHM2_9EURY|nr:MBL fold metallo-hydrolase [Archaeoglobus sulfaticallidus]AGK61812.1 Metal-dependent hydrolases of the beta-lactamase superfamily I [Archaeoglobus sulfaticallidus PM70-1]